jgi:hypothetical protein
MEILKGSLIEIIDYIENEGSNLCKNYEIGKARELYNIKCELLELRELEHITDNTQISLQTNDILGYHYEILEEEKTIEDIVNDTENEFTCALNGAVMYGSDTQAPRMLTDAEKEILKNYMSVYTSRLKENINKFEDKE